MLGYLKGRPHSDNSYEIYRKDIDELIEIITDFLKYGKYWDNSIWEFKDMIPHLAQDIVNLTWLKDYLLSKDVFTTKVEFYDSY